MKTPTARTHRIRHRGRHSLAGFLGTHDRKLRAHQAEAVTQMNAIGGVAGVTGAEVLASIEDNVTLNPVGVRDIRAEYQRGVTTVAGVEALGIPII